MQNSLETPRMAVRASPLQTLDQGQRATAANKRHSRYQPPWLEKSMDPVLNRF